MQVFQLTKMESIYCVGFIFITFLSMRAVFGQMPSRIRYCEGTNDGNAKPSSSGGNRYEELKRRYYGCTHVIGNLELTYLDASHRTLEDEASTESLSYSLSSLTPLPPDLLFLSDIQEVTGYVLISQVFDEFLELPNLRIIRGDQLYEENALTVMNTLDDRGLGLTELRLPMLHEITKGGVTFRENPKLCYIDTIEWDDMQRNLQATFLTTGDDASCQDLDCNTSCSGAGCWGPGENYCQQLTLKNCDQSCNNRCLADNTTVCCHSNCAGGCIDSTATGCFSCQELNSRSECVTSCPPREIFDEDALEYIPNDRFLFEFWYECVQICPAGTLEQGDVCVPYCSEGYTESVGECLPCDGHCPNTCNGLVGNQALTSLHLQDRRFDNCTKIDGNILINRDSFDGDVFNGIEPISPELLEIFASVTEITGYLIIDAQYQYGLANITFFRNLRIIGGSSFYVRSGEEYSLYINGEINLIDLRSLNTIEEGNVFVSGNCYISPQMFAGITDNVAQQVTIGNVASQDCESKGEVCFSECSDDGCWGPNSDQCVSCRHAELYGECVPDCSAEDGLYEVTNANDGSRMCGICHESCNDGCRGPGNYHCNSCLNVKDGAFCVDECPPSSYADMDQICQECAATCTSGCTGASNNTIGEGGCNVCDVILLDVVENFVRCLDPSEKLDELNVVEKQISMIGDISVSGSTVYQECHPECDRCEVPSDSSRCVQCRNYKQGIFCVSECVSGNFANANMTCTPCDAECLSCNGSPSECTKCKNYEVPVGNTIIKKCYETCPPELPYITDAYTCVEKCPEDHFIRKDVHCKRCNPECKGGCTNDTRSSCTTCRNVEYDGTCLPKCPDYSIEVDLKCISQNKNSDAQSGNDFKGIIFIVISVLAVLIIVLVVAIVYMILKVKRRSYSGVPIGDVPLDDVTLTEKYQKTEENGDVDA